MKASNGGRGMSDEAVKGSAIMFLISTSLIIFLGSLTATFQVMFFLEIYLLHLLLSHCNVVQASDSLLTRRGVLLG